MHPQSQSTLSSPTTPTAQSLDVCQDNDMVKKSNGLSVDKGDTSVPNDPISEDDARKQIDPVFDRLESNYAQSSVLKRFVTARYAPYKRLVDIVASVCGLMMLWPVFIVVAVMVRLDSKGPALYCQTRVGRHMKLFKAIKFRTMTVANDAGGNDGITCAGKQSRITKLGKTLRKYRIDELPQLWNVLLGEMSLVGPRPQTPGYVEYYPHIYREILSIRPGITGLASILFHETEEKMIAAAGDNAHEIYIHKILPMKFKYNLFYVHHYGLWFDIKIIWWTILGMIRKAR